MSARRVRPVLYEVASQARRHSEPIQKPAPMPTPARVTFRSAPEERQSQVESGTPSRPIGESVRAGVASLTPEFRVDSGRVFISMAWPAASVIAAVLLVALVLAFDLGRRLSVPSTAADDLELLALSGQDGPAKPNGAGDPPPAVATPPRSAPAKPPANVPKETASSERSAAEAPGDALNAKPGYKYLVIQHFPPNKGAAATAARDYLRQNGVACVVTQRGRDHVLVASEGFEIRSGRNENKAEQARADALIRRVKELGKRYVSTGGYSFDQCYLDLAD